MTQPMFLCSYRINGDEYGFEIAANDWADAERRLRAIKGNANVDGELVVKIPLPEKLGNWFVRLLGWWRGEG